MFQMTCKVGVSSVTQHGLELLSFEPQRRIHASRACIWRDERVPFGDVGS
jgi:hypothetical protein